MKPVLNKIKKNLAFLKPPAAPAIVQPYPKLRNVITDLMAEGRRKNIIHGLFEIELTKIRQFTKQYSLKTGQKLSLISYFIKTYAHAVSEKKAIQAYRDKRNGKLILFEDVDVSIMIERKVSGQHMPVAYVIRKAQLKSVDEIAKEIEAAKTSSLGQNGPLPSQAEKFFKLPRLIRKVAWFFIRRNPYLFKEVMGTVGFSSTAARSNDPWFGIPITPMTATLFTGGIHKKTVMESGRPVERSFIQVTFCADHDIIDGMQMKRFLNHFRNHLIRGTVLACKTTAEQASTELTQHAC